MPEEPKRVVSVSLGSSKRDKRQEAEILGTRFIIERIGVDGDLNAFRRKFEELDGKVDALGVGGADIRIVVGEKTYEFAQIKRLIAGATQTPVVDGSGLKHTLERRAIHWLQDTGAINFEEQRVLLVSAVDRFGMAQALDRLCPNVVYGDLLFGLGLPIPLRSYSAVERLGRLVLPVVTKLPFKWLYPTGEKQERRAPKHAKWFRWASIVCGDWHYIRRYMPEDISGTTVITQTLRRADFELLKSVHADLAITTTPLMGGETFATNVMEGVLLTLAGKRPEDMTEEDYNSALDELDWKPTLIEL